MDGGVRLARSGSPGAAITRVGVTLKSLRLWAHSPRPGFLRGEFPADAERPLAPRTPRAPRTTPFGEAALAGYAAMDSGRLCAGADQSPN